MKTKLTKPPVYPSRNHLAEVITICDKLWASAQSLKNLYKNIIAAPE